MINEDTYIGPNYPYHSKIKNPTKLGMSPVGSIIDNIGGLINYAEVLITGDSIATDHVEGNKIIRTGPLGPKFFIKTGGTCTNEQGIDVSRSAYVSNVPDGKIPFISNMLDIELSSFKGLIPGVLTNISNINPLKLLNIFNSSSECKKVTLETIDENDKREYKTRYLLTSDIADIDPCLFPCDKSGVRHNPDYKNSNKYCDTNCKDDSTQNMFAYYHINKETEETEGFKNIVDLNNLIDKSKLPNDFYMQIYFFSLALLIIYFIIKIGQRK